MNGALHPAVDLRKGFIDFGSKRDPSQTRVNQMLKALLRLKPMVGRPDPGGSLEQLDHEPGEYPTWRTSASPARA